MRLNRRRPIEETLAEVGEGRGRSNRTKPLEMSLIHEQTC